MNFPDLSGELTRLQEGPTSEAVQFLIESGDKDVIALACEYGTDALVAAMALPQVQSELQVRLGAVMIARAQQFLREDEVQRHGPEGAARIELDRLLVSVARPVRAEPLRPLPSDPDDPFA